MSITTKPMTAGELVQQDARRRRPRAVKPWKWNARDRTLGYGGYQLDLGAVQNSAQILDWIMQVSDKPWASPAVVVALLESLRSILDPQANFCSGGREPHTLDPPAK
ncbi:MAG TPA: hypothetical protein VFC78_01225 [Tepidisphaeraceae bacterium]|nr:hypothetical protein [Tepidisphaeraceae bacterium]